MEVEEFEERAKSIVEVELKKIRSIVKKIPGNNAKKQANLLGLSLSIFEYRILFFEKLF